MESNMPRSAFRDRSNNNDKVLTLIRGFIDQRDGIKARPGLQGWSSSRKSAGQGRAIAAAEVISSHDTKAAVSKTEGGCSRGSRATDARAGNGVVRDHDPGRDGGQSRRISTQSLPYGDAGHHNNDANNDANAYTRKQECRSSNTSSNGGGQGNACSGKDKDKDDSDTEGDLRPPLPPSSQPSRLPTPVACTLVAFEPGSLGLELEAIVDEDITNSRISREGDGGNGRGGRGSVGFEQHPSRRLGCRVFRVTPDGQAARHGSVHAGDALVVLDGVDVLCEEFDVITRTLLARQGRRRLMGFMGAAAVAAASPAVGKGVSTFKGQQLQQLGGGLRNRPPPATNDMRRTVVSSPPRPEGAASLHYRSQSISGVKEAQSVGGEAGEKLPRETRGRDVAMVEPGARRAERGQLEASGVSGHRRHQRPRSRPSVQPPSSLASDTGPSKEPPPERCVRDGRKAEHEMWRWSAETATVSERSERGDNARQHESRTDGRCQQGSLPGVSDTKNGGGVGDIGVGLEQRCRRTGKAGGKGENVCSEDESANRLFSSTSENASTAGNPAAAAFFAGERKEAPGKVNRREGESVGRNALGSSWGTSATATTGRRRDVDSARGRSTFRHHSSRGVRPLERSRGESLQRSLDGVMEEKSALSAERAWLLEQLEQAREATLERDGALAGQEVQTDVLRMEVKALEVELRRARQELGACEAGRRELSEASKRDITRRDRNATDLASVLKRERAARERDADIAASAMAKAVENATARAEAAGRAVVAEVERRAEIAEARAVELDERRRECEATAKDAAAEALVVASAAVRRERERREMEIRERDEEIAGLTSRMEASEARAERAGNEKNDQLRELEESAMKSLEAAERRRSEWEDKAAQITSKLRARETEVLRQDRRLKELETQLRRETLHRAELEEAGDSAKRRFEAEIEEAEKAIENGEARAQAEVKRLTKCLRNEEYKLSADTARLRKAEHRARVLETGTAAARRRAEASVRQETEALRRAAEAEGERVRHEVALTACKAQLDELRHGSAKGDAAIRETVKLRPILEGTIRMTSRLRRPPDGISLTSGESSLRDSHKGSPDSGVSAATSTAATSLTLTSSAGNKIIGIQGRHVDEKGGLEDGHGENSRGSEGLVRLAEGLRHRVEEALKELEDVRQALALARNDNEALRKREQDAADLRCLLQEKRGISTELATGAAAARARAADAETETEKARQECSSLREELHLTKRRSVEQEDRETQRLLPRIAELERALEGQRSEREATRAHVRELEGASKDARERLSPLEGALRAAKAEASEAVKRLTRKGGELVAVRSRLDETSAELQAVKISIFQGSDDRTSPQRRACVTMAVAFSRFHEHATDKALALLRWQRHATKHAAARAQRPANASGASRIVGNVPYGQRGDLEGYSVADGVGSVVGSVVGSGGGGSGGGDVHEDRVVAEFDQGIAGAAITAGGDDGTGLLREEALAARSEVEKLTRRNAEVLEDSRSARSELACLHLRTRMCGARVLSAVLHKWAARRSAKAFWRLMVMRAANEGDVPNESRHLRSATIDKKCGANVDNSVESCACNDRGDGNGTALLTIHPSTSGGICSYSHSRTPWGSPLTSGSGGSDVERGSAGSGAQFSFSPTSEDRSSSEVTSRQRRRRQRGEQRLHSPATTVTTVLASPGSGHFSDAFRSTASGDSDGGGDGDSHGQAFQRGQRGQPSKSFKREYRARPHDKGGDARGSDGDHGSGGTGEKSLPPPPSPASALARSSRREGFSNAWASSGGIGGVRGVSGDSGSGRAVVGADAMTTSPGGLAVVTTPTIAVSGETSGGGDLSFVSGVSSEPRYHCLRSDLASPTWSDDLSGGAADDSHDDDAAGSGGGDAVDDDDHDEGGLLMEISDDSGCAESVIQSVGVSHGDFDGYEIHGDGSSVKEDAEGKGVKPVETTCGLGLQIPQGGDGSWWALSDESVQL